ncbi:MAG: pyridoxal-phosphate dependent enzyme [Proteobacteria bacterium]|nr:pyridoxal-phosphate dependent enzyme [Pseudomonadota bacterium]
MPADTLCWADIEAAQARLAGRIHRTPVLSSAALDAASGARLFFKCENFQKTGAFKARGAGNAVFALADAVARRGVATHSSGNHGAALARAAQLRRIPAHVVMPEGTARVKAEAVARYGATITWCAPTLAAREATVREVLTATGATLVHPYNDYAVMAGQGTAAVELLQQVPDLDAVICPVGGGGLISGTAVAARHLRPGIGLFGAEPAGADDAARSLHSGVLQRCEKPQTIADGLRGALGDRTYPVIREQVADILTVSEESIIAAMRTLWQVLKIVAEPSGAVPLAALLMPPAALRGKRIGVIVSGGNVDLDSLPF